MKLLKLGAWSFRLARRCGMTKHLIFCLYKKPYATATKIESGGSRFNRIHRELSTALDLFNLDRIIAQIAQPLMIEKGRND